MSKRETNFIKSIAIALMLAHHFWGFPTWRVGGIQLEYSIWLNDGKSLLEVFATHFKICVATFAFLSGYGWACASSTREKTIKRIKRMLLIYEICLAIEYTIALCFDASYLNVRDLINQITVCFCGGSLFIGLSWYVQFFILAVLSFPLLSKPIGKWNIVFSLLCCFVPYWIIYIILSKFQVLEIWNGIVAGYLLYMPCVMIGAWTQKYKVFELIDSYYAPRAGKVSLAIACLVAVFAIRILTGGRLYLDVILVPIMIQSLRTLYNLTLLSKHSFKTLADCSPWMWLLHSVFYRTPVEEQLQTVLYISSSPVVVFLWGFIIVFLPSLLINTIIDSIKKLKNKY